MSRALRLLLTVALVATSSAVVRAQSVDDPPERAGRVGVIEGSMSLRAPTETEWSDAEVNFPVAPGMEFSTDDNSRAALDLGGATVSMDAHSTVGVDTFDETQTTLNVSEGSADVRVRMIFDDETFEIDTPDGRARITAPGAYRIDARAMDRPTRIVVLQGGVEFETRRGTERIRAGQALDVNDDGRIHIDTADVAAIDDWAEERAAQFSAQNTSRYVSPDMPGTADLDRAGRWEATADYGTVWYPSAVAADWAPYQDGRWAWVAPWGWTWIDAQPWGFAPFHYGRWVYVGGRWGWYPGERLRRSVYAPALVAFIGDDWRFSRSMRPRAWVPLGFGEVYRAPYSRNPRYLARINQGNVRRDRLANVRWNDRDRGDFANRAHFRSEHVNLRNDPHRSADRRADRSNRRDPINITDRNTRRDNNNERNRWNVDRRQRSDRTDTPRDDDNRRGRWDNTRSGARENVATGATTPMQTAPRGEERGRWNAERRDNTRDNNRGDDAGRQNWRQNPTLLVPPRNRPAAQIPAAVTPQPERRAWNGGENEGGRWQREERRAQQPDMNAAVPRSQPGLPDRSAENIFQGGQRGYRAERFRPGMPQQVPAQVPQQQQPQADRGERGGRNWGQRGGERNFGQNNVGQNNFGAGNVGRGNIGQTNAAPAPAAPTPDANANQGNRRGDGDGRGPGEGRRGGRDRD